MKVTCSPSMSRTLTRENEALFIADHDLTRCMQAASGIAAWRFCTARIRESRQIRRSAATLQPANLPMSSAVFSYYPAGGSQKDIIAYLKLAQMRGRILISLQRIINVPARGIGRTTVEQVEKFAAENNVGLWGAIERMLEENQFGTRAHAAMAAFSNMIRELAEAVRNETSE